MTLSGEDIVGLFQRFGWKANIEQDQTIVAVFSGKARNFPMMVTIYEKRLDIVVFDYLDLKDCVRPIEEIYHRLLELNSRIVLVKFALDSKDRIIIMANPIYEYEMPYELFEQCVGTLTFYADDAYAHLYDLIHGKNPDKNEGGKTDE